MTRDEINRETKDFREALSHHAFDHAMMPSHTQTFSLSREGAEQIRRLLDLTDKPKVTVTIHDVVASLAEVAEGEGVSKLVWVSAGAAGCLVQGERLRQRLNGFKTATQKLDLRYRLEEARDEPGCSMVPVMPAEALALLCLVTSADSAERLKIDPDAVDREHHSGGQVRVYLGRDPTGHHLWRNQLTGVIETDDQPPPIYPAEPGVKLPPAGEDPATLAKALAERDRARDLLERALGLIEVLIEDRGQER